MSYVLHLWEHPVPASVAEADRIHTRLSAERTSQNPKFIELAKRLTERYPCMTTLEDDDLEVAWSDGPLDGKTDSPVYTLGVQTAMLGEVVPFVAGTANGLGLTVYDTQAAEVHLPGGTVLTLPERAAVDFRRPDEPEVLDSRSQAAGLLVECLKPLLQHHGFKAVAGNASFKRKSKEAEQTLSFDIVESTRSCLIEFFFTVKPIHSESLQGIADQHAWSGYILDMEKAADVAGVERFGDQPQANGRSRMGSVSALRSWARALEVFLLRVVIPIAGECTTIEGMERLVNPLSGAVSPFRQYASALILARAVKSPRFDELAAAWLQSATEPSGREKIQRLVTALKTAG